MIRETGWYWVKLDVEDEWIIAQWCPEQVSWDHDPGSIFGWSLDDTAKADKDIAAIGHRILPPAGEAEL